MEIKTKKIKMQYIALMVIIIAQLVYTCVYYFTVKQGVGVEETESFGLSNSYYKAWIDKKGDVSSIVLTGEEYSEEELENVNEWVNSEVFHDYLTVQKSERFSYGSVWHNMEKDGHPPLYYALVHTLSSLFYDRYDFDMLFAINCICLILGTIYLYKLAKLFLGTQNSNWALLVCVFYGFSAGACSTFILLRLYAMLTMFGIMHLYYQFKFAECEKGAWKLLVPVGVTGFLGFMTEYLFIVFAGLCTLCICLHFWFKRDFKKFFSLGGTMLFSLGAFFIAVPFAYKHITNYTVNRSYSVYRQFRALLGFCTSGTLGFGVSMLDTATSGIVTAVLAGIVVVALPICFLCRKEQWFRNAVKTTKDFFASIKRRISNYYKAGNFYQSVTLFIMCGVYILIAAGTVDIVVYSKSCVRYVMILMPIFSMLGVFIIKSAAQLFIHRKKILDSAVYVVCAVLLVIINVNRNDCFAYKQPEQTQPLSVQVKGKRCAVILKDDPEWIISAFAPDLTECKSVYFTRVSDMEDKSTADFLEFGAGETVYLLVPDPAEDDSFEEHDGYLEQVQNAKGVTKVEFCNYIKFENDKYDVYEIS